MKSKKNQVSHGGVVMRSADLPGKEGDREEDIYVINLYHTGDIIVQMPVYLAPTASLVGNITAPKVIIAGKMFGIIAADEVLIAQGGHIWGDIYTTEMELEPEGKCFGWVITLDMGTMELLRSGDIKRSDLPASGKHVVHSGFRKEHAIAEGQEPHHPGLQRFLLHHFQSELAAAQMARIEIELTFEERLAEALRQSEVHLLFDTGEDSRSSGAGLNQEDTVSSGTDPESFPPAIQEQLQQLENELMAYKQMTADYLEQLARINAMQSATESELQQMREKTERITTERDDLRTALGEVSVYDVLPETDELGSRSDSFRKLKADLAGARLRIIELEADLAYCQHLNRKSERREIDL